MPTACPACSPVPDAPVRLVCIQRVPCTKEKPSSAMLYLFEEELIIDSNTVVRVIVSVRFICPPPASWTRSIELRAWTTRSSVSSRAKSSAPYVDDSLSLFPFELPVAAWHVDVAFFYCSNEMNYIKAHPFSAVSLGAGSEVYIPLSQNIFCFHEFFNRCRFKFDHHRCAT